jgi:hypothetical protein
VVELHLAQTEMNSNPDMHNDSSVEKMPSQEFKNDPESMHTEMVPGGVGINDDHPVDKQQWLNPMFFGTYMVRGYRQNAPIVRLTFYRRCPLG